MLIANFLSQNTRHLSAVCRAGYIANKVWLVNNRKSHNGNGGSDGRSDSYKSNKFLLGGLLSVGGICGGFAIFKFFDERKADKNETQLEPAIKSDPARWALTVRKDLPTYRSSDVQKHSTIEKGVWITYRVGVYDITKFIPQHPGSDKIMMGAGSAIDAFWETYQQHKTTQILTLLETFRIGNLHPDDIIKQDEDLQWANEPERSPILKPSAKRPFNAEPPSKILVENFLTPEEVFYVRNHLPVPVIDEGSYELEVEVEKTKAGKTFCLDDIKKFQKYTVTSAVMCGGNRRGDMHAVKPVKGLNWGSAAVGNAEWSGARLRDILTELGVKSDEERQVIFEGYDLDPAGSPYGASIPLYKAMDERGDVLLAYEMNGKPLTRDHGYPLRVIVPGVVGARNVKWVSRIIVSDKESDSLWQQKDYKGFSPSTDWDTVDFTKSPAIQHMPVNSAICTPNPGDKVKVKDGHITVKGYAWSGGGNRIVRVDVTLDGGKKWHVAELEQTDDKAGRHYGWTLWTARLPVAENAKTVEIWAKAVDSNYNVQPETFENTWNLRGVLSHAYHRVKVDLIK